MDETRISAAVAGKLSALRTKKYLDRPGYGPQSCERKFHETGPQAALVRWNARRRARRHR